MLGFKSQPAGLSTLFFTELWERFSYYGMRAILVLYLVLPVAQGGMGFSATHAAVIYGNYTMSVYLLSVVGGYIADRYVGAARAVVIGALLICAGHFSLAFGSAGSLYAGLSLVAAGTSLLKPNIVGLVGRLYPDADLRRDSGFSLFYMGINIGAFVAPLICGWLAQGEAFRGWLETNGFDMHKSWHWGFGAAGAGMLIGLATFLRSWRQFAQRPATPSVAPHTVGQPDRRRDAQRLGAILFFCVGALIFFALADQAGSSLNLFADRHTRSEVFGWTFPSSWFQSVSSGFVILLAPVFALLWIRLGPRQPSSPVKAVIGLAAAMLSFLVMSAGARAAGLGPVSPAWLIAVYFIQTIGELCLSPVGLSRVTRLAPAHLVGVVIGLWFVAIAFGSKLAGLAAEWFGGGTLSELPDIFMRQALLVGAACLVLACLAPWVARVIRETERA